MSPARTILFAAVLLVTFLLAASGAPSRAQGPTGFDASTRGADLDSQIADAMAGIERGEARAARVDAEIEGLGQRRNAARRRLRTRARALYRMRRAGMLPLAGGMDALLGHMARVERLERMVRLDADALSSLTNRGGALRSESASVGANLETARLRLQQLTEQKQVMEEEQRMAAMFGTAFDLDVPGSYYQPGYGSLRVVDEDPSQRQSFVLARGRLGLPVGGAADVREGRREGSAGLEFLTPPGTVVRAVYDGHVAFADTYGAYGTLVILDHGGSYFTVYGGLGRVEVGVGAPVSRGSRMGVVGAGGQSEGLFFEVRRGTRALDAPSWLGL